MSWDDNNDDYQGDEVVEWAMYLNGDEDDCVGYIALIEPSKPERGEVYEGDDGNDYRVTRVNYRDCSCNVKPY